MGLVTGMISVLGLVCLLSSTAISATLPPVKAYWDANPESDIAGYELMFGTASGRYSTKLNVGKKTETSVTGLKSGVKYYFAVVAYNTSGQRSEPSDELTYIKKGGTGSNGTPDGTISSPSTGGTVIAGESVRFTGTGSDPNGDTPLSYRWSFGAGSGIENVREKDPGNIKFNIPGTYQVTLTVIDSKGRVDPTPATRTITVLSSWSIVPRSAWKLKYVNSEEPNGYAATQSFDGNPSTFWHSRFTSNKLPPPHQIQIDVGKATLVKGFQYLPRQDGQTVGDIGKYQFYVSMDGASWGKPVATGQFTASSSEKRVFCTPKRGKFVRLVSLGDATGNTDCNVAEFNVLEGPPLNRKPTAAARSVKALKDRKAVITLKGSDADNNPLTYQIITRPKQGKLTGSPPNLTYKPDKKFTGVDKFTYRVSDGQMTSKPATVTIRVKDSKSSGKSALLAAASGRSSASPASAAAAIGFSAAPDSSPVIGTEIIDGVKYLTLTAAKPAMPDGVKRSVQVSPNLVDWFSGKNHTTVLTDNGRFLKVRDNTPLAPGRKRYIRLKTSRN
jgi:chitodextrinase